MKPTRLNYDTFAKGLMLICETWQQELSQAAIEGYYSALKDLTDDQFGVAVSTLMENHVYARLPVPAAFRVAALGQQGGRAIIAFCKVEQAIRSYGAYLSVSFDDPVIHRVVNAMGGWAKLCRSDETEWKWKEKEFVRLYEALQGSDDMETPARLAGEVEITNAALGYDKRRLKVGYVGDKQKIIESRNEQKQIGSGETININVRELLARIGRRDEDTDTSK